MEKDLDQRYSIEEENLITPNDIESTVMIKKAAFGRKFIPKLEHGFIFCSTDLLITGHGRHNTIQVLFTAQ